jgi:hypothetical protein
MSVFVPCILRVFLCGERWLIRSIFTCWQCCNTFVVRTVDAAICFPSTYNCVGFEFPTAVVMQSSVFWNITTCSPLKVNRRLRETYLLCMPSVFTLVTCSAYSSPWKWRRCVPSKRQLIFNGLHGVVTQKIVLYLQLQWYNEIIVMPLGCCFVIYCYCCFVMA